MSTKVLPLEKLLREGWNSNAYVRGIEGDRPFAVEDSSKKHITRITQLMKNDLDWCFIGMIKMIAKESEIIGKWCEGCGCHNDDLESLATETEDAIVIIDGVANVEVTRCHAKSRKVPRTLGQLEAANCPFRCCRAPELALGWAARLQRRCMSIQGPLFNKLTSRAPAKDRGLLIAAWNAARSRLYGVLGFASNSCFSQ